MATTYPLATLGPTVSSSGISAPSYNDIYASLQASYQGIFGTDAYVAPDSQDGQLLAVVAKAISDSNNTAISLYNSYSPASAQGTNLSNAVKINGMVRNSATYSTAIVTVTGQVGTVIANGVIQDTNKNKWNLPASVTIPSAGTIDVTATSQTAGSIAAAPSTINQIVTPTLGWQTVNNAAAASLGAPVETDAALRQRQVISTSLPSKTVLNGIAAAVAACAGVTQVLAYENDTNTTDANGLPPHSIAIVALGGTATDIANAIYKKKTPGSYTYGTTSTTVTDQFGIVNIIRFFIPTSVPIKIGITVKALTGYTTAIGNQILASLAAYINALGIRKTVMIPRLYMPAQLYGGQGSETFEIQLLQISINPAAVGNTDVVTAFNQIPTSDVANMTLTVV